MVIITILIILHIIAGDILAIIHHTIAITTITIIAITIIMETIIITMIHTAITIAMIIILCITDQEVLYLQNQTAIDRLKL